MGFRFPQSFERGNGCSDSRMFGYSESQIGLSLNLRHYLLSQITQAALFLVFSDVNEMIGLRAQS